MTATIDPEMMIDDHIETTGTMDGFTPARIKDEDVAAVMQLLTRAYSRPRDAVIRELVANGVDSHREAGVSVPVEVDLPTMDNPHLVVTDHGLGLSPDDIDDTFGNIGSSTKRKNKKATGHMGIGSKSPMAVADQFTVDAVKDGQRTVLLFVKAAGGLSSKKMLSSSTDEANRVSVSVPVSYESIQDWMTAARNTMGWRNRGEVVVRSNGEPIKLDHYEDQIVDWTHTDNVFATKSAKWGNQARILMGGIIYDVPREATEKFMGKAPISLVFELPPKGAQVAPSREAIEDTDALRSTLRNMHRTWKKSALRRAIQMFSECTSSYEIAELWKQNASDAYTTPFQAIMWHLGFTEVKKLIEFFNMPYQVEIDTIRNRRPQYSKVFSDNSVSKITAEEIAMRVHKGIPFVMIDGKVTSAKYEEIEHPDFQKKIRKARRTITEWNRAFPRYTEAIITDARGIDELTRLTHRETMKIATVDQLRAEIPKAPRNDNREDPFLSVVMGRHSLTKLNTTEWRLSYLLQANSFLNVSEYLADENNLVVSTTTKEMLAEDEFSSAIADGWEFPYRDALVILAKNRAPKNLAKLLGIDASRIVSREEYLVRERSRIVKTMTKAQRRNIAEAAVVQKVITYRGRRYLEDVLDEDAQKLSPIVKKTLEMILKAHSAGNQGTAWLLRDPNMPEPMMETHFPLTLEVLDNHSTPSLPLLTTLIEAEVKAAKAATTTSTSAQKERA